MHSLSTIWLAAAVFVILLAVFGMMIAIGRKRKRTLGYFGMFLMGVIWIIGGVLMGALLPDGESGWGLAIVGLVLTMIGFFHRHRWNEELRSWPGFAQNRKP